MRLILHHVRLAINGRALFRPLSFTIMPPKPTTLIGPSGSGKSSLLNWLGGHLPPAFEAEGEAYLDDKRIDLLPSEERRLGILFQDDLLFPHLTVWQNLAFGIRPGLSRVLRDQKILAALKQAGMEYDADRDPASLSGGQRARIALLRVLLSEPLALLLDEPFSKLDTALRERFRREIFTSAAERQIPVLQVSHDAQDAQAANGPVLDLAQ